MAHDTSNTSFTEDIVDTEPFPEIPAEARAVEVKRDPEGRWALRRQLRQPSAHRVSPSTDGTFQAYLLGLDEWETELLSNLQSRWSIFEMCEILKGSFCLVSDGAAAQMQVGSYAWVLSSPSGQRVLRGSGPVRGGRISSYRAEAYGVLAAVRFIHHVMKYTSMSIPFHGQMACDNKAIVQQVSTFLPTPVLGNDGQTSTTGVRRHFTLDPLAPEWDLLIEIYHTVCDTWTDTTIQHVKGHQDQDAEKGDLPLLAQLNIEADQLAGQHQRQHPEPSPRARLLPHTGAHLHLPSGTVTSRYDQTLRQTYTSSMSISYLQSRFSWAPDVFAMIDWEAHGKALRRQRARHVHFTKLVYDILPTNKVLHRYSASTSPMCPCCLQVEETRDHLLQCTATEEWRQQFISKLDLRCGELNASPRLRAYLLQCIQDWLRSGDQMSMNNYPAQFRTITETQSAIGWRHLFSGRFSTEWAVAQSSFLEHRRVFTPTAAGTRWLVDIITTIWHQ